MDYGLLAVKEGFPVCLEWHLPSGLREIHVFSLWSCNNYHNYLEPRPDTCYNYHMAKKASGLNGKRRGWRVTDEAAAKLIAWTAAQSPPVTVEVGLDRLLMGLGGGADAVVAPTLAVREPVRAATVPKPAAPAQRAPPPSPPVQAGPVAPARPGVRLPEAECAARTQQFLEEWQAEKSG